MKQLKDYLHLYLGCECVIQGEESAYTITGISYDDTQKILWCYFENCEGGHYPIEDVSPVLSPLSSMAEDEYEEWGIIDRPITGTSDLIRHEAEKTKYLLSKHFDLFGLIDAGLAIDKTTLQ